MEIYIAADGRVLSYILDPNFEKYLPIIPSEVTFVFVFLCNLAYTYA